MSTDSFEAHGNYQNYQGYGERKGIGFTVDFDDQAFRFSIIIRPESTKLIDPHYFSMSSPVHSGPMSSRLRVLADMIYKIEEHNNGNQP